jgi:lipoic acid synthetase
LLSRPTDGAEPRAEPRRKPAWVRARVPSGRSVQSLRALLSGLRLHTVCESARCPNLAECWSDRTATIMILGDVCTRSCGFCAVRTGRPLLPPDPEEPERVAEAVRRMGLHHAVITSVNRDELPDGGAAAFAATIRAVRRANPHCAVEALIPDFQGNWAALATLLAAAPDVLNHNLETVPRLYRRVRPQAKYARSLEVLLRSSEAGLVVKSGIMVGLGERMDELWAVMGDVVAVACDIFTVGQYLQPTPAHLPVERYYAPEDFAALAAAGRRRGIRHVEAGVLVRSSYHARGQMAALRGARCHL